MSDEQKPIDETPQAPAADPNELTDQDLEKVSGGIGAISTTQLKATTATTANVANEPGTLKGWGDPHV